MALLGLFGGGGSGGIAGLISSILGDKNQQGTSGLDSLGYFGSPLWTSYGRTEPAFWSNPTDTGYGTWGQGIAGSAIPGNENSLLDILSQLQPSDLGINFRPQASYWRW